MQFIFRTETLKLRDISILLQLNTFNFTLYTTVTLIFKNKLSQRLNAEPRVFLKKKVDYMRRYVRIIFKKKSTNWFLILE